MDDKWFKQAQRRAGVTAEDIARELGRDRSVVSRIYVGRQKMSLDQARVFARILDVPLADVLERAGVTEKTEAAAFTPGFAEGDVIPFTHQRQPGTADPIDTALGADRPGVDVWQVSGTSLLYLGFRPGDHILIDTHAAERCAADDVVIAQVYDYQTGSAVTVLRQFQPPVLIGAGPSDGDMKAYVVDGRNVVIRGRAIASWRRLAS